MIKSFLDKYDTLIFDMDGVVTSENGYWDAAALTVCEYLTSREHFGDADIDTVYMSDNADKIRENIFLNDKLIKLFKEMGVNSNWDLGYITVLTALITGTKDTRAVYDYAKGIDEDIIVAYDTLAKLAAEKMNVPYEKFIRNGELWSEMRDSFQEWYLGDELFNEVYGYVPKKSGKAGIYKREQPLLPLEKTRTILTELGKTKRLCVGTGRLYNEIGPLLKNWGVLDLFDKNGLCNYNHVIEAENELGLTLTKPHPYMFLKALYGTDYQNHKIIDNDYDKSKIERTLVIGDAGADILAAHAMGADFCAVLTGVSGVAGRAYFETQNSEYILHDISELLSD